MKKIFNNNKNTGIKAPYAGVELHNANPVEKENSFSSDRPLGLRWEQMSIPRVSSPCAEKKTEENINNNNNNNLKLDAGLQSGPVTKQVSSGDSLKANLSGENSQINLVAGNPVLKPVAKEYILNLNNLEENKNIEINLLNKKRNKDEFFEEKKKLRKIKNEYIDDEASASDKSIIDSEDNNEKNEYDLNDKFIDDNNENNNNNFLDYINYNNKIDENKDKYIVLNPKKFIETFDVDNCLNY